MGYFRAGFTEIVGVDIKPQPRYPFTFELGDALAFVEKHGHEFDVIHASPPCQRYARISRVHGRQNDHPDLLGPTRDLLIRTGKPYVIENVSDAEMPNAFILCGSMFGLGAQCQDGKWRHLKRHRKFESSETWLTLSCQCDGQPIGVYGHGGPLRAPRNRGYMGAMRERQEAMGIEWMRNAELSQAIPPAYTEWIGRQLLAHAGEAGDAR